MRQADHGPGRYRTRNTAYHPAVGRDTAALSRHPGYGSAQTRLGLHPVTPQRSHFTRSNQPLSSTRWRRWNPRRQRSDAALTAEPRSAGFMAVLEAPRDRLAVPANRAGRGAERCALAVGVVERANVAAGKVQRPYGCGIEATSAFGIAPLQRMGGRVVVFRHRCAPSRPIRERWASLHRTPVGDDASHTTQATILARPCAYSACQ